MAKKLYAVTNIKCSTGEYNAGDELDPKSFNPDDLKSLYDAGALRIEDVEEEETTAKPEQLPTRQDETLNTEDPTRKDVPSEEVMPTE